MRQTVSHVSVVSGLVAWGLLAAVTLCANPVNSLFNPADYPTVDTSLVLTGGTVVVDTKDGTNAPTWTYNGSLAYTGCIVTNQSGKVVMALFNFGGLAISNGVSCTITGDLGLVLSSTGDFTMASTLDLSGTSSASTNGWGGPGAEGGVRATSTSSAPPGAARGNGGFNKHDGIGFGAGSGGTYASSGAGYGGGGGYGGKNGNGPVLGGTNYGDSAGLLVDLFGGSGGGAGTNKASAGGGGGALELIANGTLTITATATQKVNGATAGYAGGTPNDPSAGGGSGGGIILAANRLEVHGTIQAKGGDGKGDAITAAGGGGGGRIAFYANALNNAAVSVSVAGGAKGGTGAATNGQNGAMGTFRWLGDGQGGDLSYPYTQDLPALSAPSATNVRTRSADLVVNLLSTSGDPNTSVFCYWGTNSASWDYGVSLGAFSTGGFVTNTVTGLSPGTTYYFTFAASNRIGMAFAPTTNSFSTLALWPTIVNVGTSNLTANGATVYGYLSNTGESATVVYLFWGLAPGVWMGTNTSVPGALGLVSNALSGLTQNTAYYCQYAASNAAGWSYAATNRFATLPVLGQAAEQGSLFNPRRYATLADSLVVTNGTIVIDTGDFTTRGPSMTVNGTSYRGQVAPNLSGNVWLALFNFGNLAISNGVSCTVTGNLGLVLASAADLTMSANLDLGGAAGAAGVTGVGGPGAEGGSRINLFGSAPPGPTRGNGGCNPQAGIGGGRATGIGFGAGTFDNSASLAGGGGYGGVGGNVSNTTVLLEGGTNYGDAAVSNLFGGSGGGCGSRSGTQAILAGGGGGGALELIANGTLTIGATATQKVSGGAAYASAWTSAGGGSGGGILLAANRLNVYGTIQAKGGDGSGNAGGGGSYPGGGGGGGRIAFYANTLTTNTGTKVSFAGGAKANNGQDGAPGTFRFAGDGGAGDLSFPYAVRGTALTIR